MTEDDSSGIMIKQRKESVPHRDGDDGDGEGEGMVTVTKSGSHLLALPLPLFPSGEYRMQGGHHLLALWPQPVPIPPSF